MLYQPDIPSFLLSEEDGLFGDIDKFLQYVVSEQRQQEWEEIIAFRKKKDLTLLEGTASSDIIFPSEPHEDLEGSVIFPF